MYTCTVVCVDRKVCTYVCSTQFSVYGEMCYNALA